ncbi:unnamed protein product [Dovyalis caffra]|uniref:Uncharacterized protein n=1 Tax=Dovyalis caffra TaxID=77055 RepID=A0AAV1R9L3_9ROSI|nr:unnamed protein product [Dovyalis caffra]
MAAALCSPLLEKIKEEISVVMHEAHNTKLKPLRSLYLRMMTSKVVIYLTVRNVPALGCNYDLFLPLMEMLRKSEMTLFNWTKVTQTKGIDGSDALGYDHDN